MSNYEQLQAEYREWRSTAKSGEQMPMDLQKRVQAYHQERDSSRGVYCDRIIQHLDRWDLSDFDRDSIRKLISHAPIALLKEYFDILLDQTACGEDDEPSI